MVQFASAAELLEPLAAAAARCGPAPLARPGPLLRASAGRRELTGQKAHPTNT